MKKITLSLVSVIALSSFGFGGGNIEPIPAPEPIATEGTPSAFYLGLGLNVLSARDADASLSFFSGKTGQKRMVGVALLAGYDFNEYIAVEGRYTTSIYKDDTTAEMSAYSIFVKPQYRFQDENGQLGAFNIYALLGFGGVKMDPVNDSHVYADDTSFQWGLGVSYDFDESLTLFVDYTSLANGMDGTWSNGALEVSADALTVGMTYRF